MLSPVELYNQTIEEIEGARVYIEKALELKSSDKDVSKQFYEMSIQEVKHSETLNKLAEKMWHDVKDSANTDMLEYIRFLRDKILHSTISLKAATLMYESSY